MFDLEKLPYPSVMISRLNHNIIHINPKACELFGYTKEHLCNSSLLDIPLWPDKSDIKRFLQNNDPTEYARLHNANNKLLHLNVSKVNDGEVIYLFFQDITPTLALQYELTQTKNNLAEAQNLARLGFWERDLLTGELTWSDNMESIYGIALPSAQEIKALIHPEDLPKFEKRIVDAVVEGMFYELDYRINHPSGVVKHIWSRVQPRKDRTGRVIKRFGTVQDITERKQMEQSLREMSERKLAEEALKQNEAQLREQQDYFSAVINEAPVMVFVKNSSGQYTLANKAVADHFGCSIEFMLGKTDHELCVMVEEAVAIVSKDKEAYEARVLFEEAVTNHKGELRYFQTVKAPLLLPDGTTQIICVALDITQHKRSEEARRISEEQYKRLFETAKDGLLLIHYESGFIYDVNPSFLSLTGYSREDFVGRPVWESLAFQNVWSDKALFYENITSRDCLPELKLTRNGGTELVVEFVSSSYYESDERIVLCSARDVTDKIRLNAELARLDRLNVVGEMAASIAHEIRNPMTTVRGFLQLLSRRAELEPHHHIMKLMIEELDRANDIITTYLSLARTSVNTVPCHLSNLVNAFAPILNADIVMRDRNIRYELHHTSPIPVCEAEIRQLLANLVRNACEAMTQGGTVSIIVHETVDHISLSVLDEGCGIPKELIPRLGTPFLTTKDNGVGLGLAICYRIAERHGATIQVDSSHLGSKFTINFPKGHNL